MSTPLTAVITQSLTLARQSVAVDTQDLANLDTPGYAGARLSWQSALAQALSQGPAAVAAVRGTSVIEPGALSPNGNSVSLTATMNDLTRQQLLYEVGVQALQAEASTDQNVANLQGA